MATKRRGIKGFMVPPHLVDTTMRSPVGVYQAKTKAKMQVLGGKRTSINLTGEDVGHIKVCKARYGLKDDSAAIRFALAELAKRDA